MGLRTAMHILHTDELQRWAQPTHVRARVQYRAV
jgi:hypothetical protein